MSVASIDIDCQCHWVSALSNLNTWTLNVFVVRWTWNTVDQGDFECLSYWINIAQETGEIKKIGEVKNK